MHTLTTILQLALLWLAAYVMGIGVVKALFPEDLEHEYGACITPTVGYLTFCFASFTISASFGIAAATASWIVIVALAAAAVAVQLDPRWRVRPRQDLRAIGSTLVLATPMAAITLLPFFIFGADTYLGAVNPDYFAGLVDDYFLLKGHSVSTFAPASVDSFYPIDHAAGHLSASARFGAGMFGIAAHQLLGVELRTALTLCIAFFLLSVPPTVYFFSRVVLQLDPVTAKWAAWLMGISGPIGMSYLYFYLGQNSGLPALPLLAAAGYLMVVRPGAKTLIFAAILANALFVNYFAMLPYALAPAGALGLYLVYKRRLSLGRALILAGAFLAISILLKLGNLGDTIDSMRAWANVIGQTLQGQFFLDFLTEAFFPFFVGIYNYPSNPWLVKWLGRDNATSLAVFLAFALTALVLWCIWRWARDVRDDASRVFVISAIVIYGAVWARYTFAQQYGYAVFKMSSWLQFILVPFVAYGFHRFARPRAMTATARTRGMPDLALAGCVLFVVLNVITSGIYAYNGAGRNTDNGYIVNHFGMAGNRDFFPLQEALDRFVKPDESVGMIFTDSIRHYWTSWYARGTRQSILSHEIMPGDDENLPDVETNTVVDYYGNVRKSHNAYFHGGVSDHFYLTWGPADINQDIATPRFAGEPLWENGSFRLYSRDAARDILFTGRGFYRIEYFQPVTTYHWPRVMRWSADGGEFYLLHPSRPGEPYHLVLDVMVGFEHHSDSRTLEIFHDGAKVQELSVTSTARVVTGPFRPREGMNKLVVRVKERNRPVQRPLALWNRDIPADYRRLNVAFANVSALPPDATLAPSPALGASVPFVGWHALAHRYNGLQPDGWIAERAEIKLSVPDGATRVVLKGMAAGNLGLRFPMTLKFEVNGRVTDKVLPAPGDFNAELALQPGERTAAIAVQAPQSTDIGERGLRLKIVRRSLRLDQITFR